MTALRLFPPAEQRPERLPTSARSARDQRSRALRHAGLALVAGCAVACHKPTGGPPATDFLVFTPDSTYWVHSGAQGVHARGSPIQLARYDGKFYEVYVADDDRSYTNAEIVGQQVWRRDIESGDSSLIFRDTTTDGIEQWYARTHPDDHPLEPDDDPEDNPQVSATSELDLLDQFGPYVSYEYRADLTLDAGDEWHVARRGVLDLRLARDVSLDDLFGDASARALVAKGRTLFSQALDSVLASHDTRARQAADAIGDFTFDSASYNLVERDGKPAIEFVSPGRGSRGGGLTLQLPPIPAASPAWWNEREAGLPDTRDSTNARWRSGRLEVLARSAAGGDSTSVALIDSTKRAWNVGEVSGPVQRVYWLNKPATDATTLHALARAFDEAALYSDQARTAMNKVPPDSNSAQTAHLASREGRPVRASQHETSEIMMPQHANVLGHVFGGVILSMMDRTAAVAAIRHARGNCVTVSVDRVDFREPIHVGDLVIMKASVNYAGRTSMEVGVRVEAENMISGVRRHTNSCYVTFVAIDRNGRPVEVPHVIPETDVERRRFAAALDRRRRRLEERNAEESGRGGAGGAGTVSG
ncbi:MAG: acyl-CoA thioesterase [Gemmatimonadaceae bacterium]